MSQGEAKKWLEQHPPNSYVEDEGLHIFFEAERPNFSPEVYLAVLMMVPAAGQQGLQQPFTVEVWDAHGQLFARTEIDPDTVEGCRGASDLVYCAHIPFPVTVKLIDSNGCGFVEVLERPQ